MALERCGDYAVTLALHRPVEIDKDKRPEILRAGLSVPSDALAAFAFEDPFGAEAAPDLDSPSRRDMAHGPKRDAPSFEGESLQRLVSSQRNPYDCSEVGTWVISRSGGSHSR